MDAKLWKRFLSNSAGNHTRYEEVPTDEKVIIDNGQLRSRPLLSIFTFVACIVISFGIGVVATILGQKSSYGPTCWVPAPLSPIPSEVIGPRVEKVFNPDARYIGPSIEVDQNWKNLVGK